MALHVLNGVIADTIHGLNEPAFGDSVLWTAYAALADQLTQ
jgi:hypothetical protein